MLSSNSLEKVSVTLWSFYRVLHAIIGDSRNEMISQNDLLIKIFHWPFIVIADLWMLADLAFIVGEIFIFA